MQLNTVIFDMDGLLVDSEPLWNEAADEVFRLYGLKLSEEQHNSTTGLRTKEFVEWWFRQYNIDEAEQQLAEEKITTLVIEKIKNRGTIMPGVHHIFRFFYERHFKIGVASSSPQKLIDVVLDLCGVRKAVQATASAEQLLFGKPHPQVFLNCADALGSKPWNCLCFEDSFNGLIAAKAAR
ncbi:MAG TPA: hexitol phosphatase HxpB, partial [Chitinophagaceae bacterium]|nr:hexitol phosphatase HxpB [Chitinophagaceae bacterium]